MTAYLCSRLSGTTGWEEEPGGKGVLEGWGLDSFRGSFTHPSGGGRWLAARTPTPVRVHAGFKK